MVPETDLIINLFSIETDVWPIRMKSFFVTNTCRFNVGPDFKNYKAQKLNGKKEEKGLFLALQ